MKEFWSWQFYAGSVLLDKQSACGYKSSDFLNFSSNKYGKKCLPTLIQMVSILVWWCSADAVMKYNAADTNVYDGLQGLTRQI